MTDGGPDRVRGWNSQSADEISVRRQWRVPERVSVVSLLLRIQRRVRSRDIVLLRGSGELGRGSGATEDTDCDGALMGDVLEFKKKPVSPGARPGGHCACARPGGHCACGWLVPRKISIEGYGLSPNMIERLSYECPCCGTELINLGTLVDA